MRWRHSELNDGLPRFPCEYGLTQIQAGGHAVAGMIISHVRHSTNLAGNSTYLEVLGGERRNLQLRAFTKASFGDVLFHFKR